MPPRRRDATVAHRLLIEPPRVLEARLQPSFGSRARSSPSSRATIHWLASGRPVQKCPPNSASASPLGSPVVRRLPRLEGKADETDAPTPSPSPPTQRLQDLHLIRRTQRRLESPDLLSVHKDPDVRADDVLFVDHPE